MFLSRNFTLEEFYKSDIAIDKKINNKIPLELMDNIDFTASGLERVRAFLYDNQIKINSGYRCPALNEAVGGSKNSQHILGQAVDFVCPNFGMSRDVFEFLKTPIKILGIDQLIREKSWVHISFTKNPRYQILDKS